MVFKLAPNHGDLLLHTLTIFAQVPYLLFDMRNFRVDRIKLALSLMQAVTDGIMLSALFFQALFRFTQVRGFDFEGCLQ